MHAMAMLWSGVSAPADAIEASQDLRYFGARADSAAIAHLDLSSNAALEGFTALLASPADLAHTPGGASRCAVALTGRLDNERALRRRLVASGAVSMNASPATMVRRLFEFYLAQHRDGQKLVEAVVSHLRGEYALIALAPTSHGPLLAGLHKGAPLWLYRNDDVVRLSTRRLASMRCDAQRLDAGDLILAYPDRVAIVDTDGMRIERPMNALGRTAIQGGAQAAAV